MRERRQARVGDWLRFYRDSKLVIGVVQYIQPRDSEEFPWNYMTDLGVTMDYIEARSPSGTRS